MTPTFLRAGIALALILAFGPTALAFNGNPENGKRLFMQKGPSGKACMTCHPKGLTTGETYKGKDIPDLTEGPIAEAKLRKKTLKFLEVQGLQLSPAELEDLLTFEAGLPSKGFGPVPAAWQGYVRSKLGE
ncbi:hypothetical protein D3C72_657340 [compost metagenome]